MARVEFGEENLPLVSVPFAIGLPYRGTFTSVERAFWAKEYEEAQRETENILRQDNIFSFDTLARKAWILAISKNHAEAFKVCKLSLIALNKERSELVESKDLSSSVYSYLRIKLLTDARDFAQAFKLQSLESLKSLSYRARLESYFFLKSAKQKSQSISFMKEVKKLGYSRRVYNGLAKSAFIYREQFSKEKWANGLLMDNYSLNSRLYSLGDLLKRYNLLQLSRNQLLELLGPPVFWPKAPVNTDTFALGFDGVRTVYLRTPIWLMCVHYDLDNKPAFIEILQAPMTCVPDALFRPIK